MEGPYSEVAKDREEGNVADHNTEAADHISKAGDNRSVVADHKTKAADNRSEAADHRSKAADNKTNAADNRSEVADHETIAADHKTKAADHNTPEHNDCLPADGCLTASRFPESVDEFRRRREKTRQVCWPHRPVVKL